MGTSTRGSFHARTPLRTTARAAPITPRVLCVTTPPRTPLQQKNDAERERLRAELGASMHLRASSYDPPEPQWWHWPLAASALYSVWNDTAWDRLHFKDAEHSRELLRRDWGVTDRHDLLWQLHQLMVGTHGPLHAERIRAWRSIPTEQKAEVEASVNQLAREIDDDELGWQFMAVRNDANKISQVNMAAFDLLRVLLLSRHGATAGYFTDEEAWDFMLLPSYRIQSEWSDWRTMARDFKLSRWIWAGPDGELRQLMRCEVPVGVLSRPWAGPGTLAGPWAVIPFDLPLPPSRQLLVQAWVREDVVKPLTPQAHRVADRWQLGLDDLVRQHSGLPPAA